MKVFIYKIFSIFNLQRFTQGVYCLSECSIVSYTHTQPETDLLHDTTHTSTFLPCPNTLWRKYILTPIYIFDQVSCVSLTLPTACYYELSYTMQFTFFYFFYCCRVSIIFNYMNNKLVLSMCFNYIFNSVFNYKVRVIHYQNNCKKLHKTCIFGWFLDWWYNVHFFM